MAKHSIPKLSCQAAAPALREHGPHSSVTRREPAGLLQGRPR